MRHRVILAVLDGLRPDAIRHPIFNELKQKGSSTYCAQSLNPPITFPIHVSLFTGLPPKKHGFLSNKAPEIDCGLVTLPELAQKHGIRTAFFADWEPFLHIVKRSALTLLEYANPELLRHATKDEQIQAQIAWTKKAAATVTEDKVDFLFYHYMFLDHMGHCFGWMSDSYLMASDLAGECVIILLNSLQRGDTLILLADHGGHGDDHFDPQNPEDMTVPVWCIGRGFQAGGILQDVTLLDIAPTVAELFEIGGTFEGKSLVNIQM